MSNNKIDEKFFTTVKSLNIEAGDERVFLCQMSVEVLDREGEVILVDGIDTSEYQTLSPLLLNHDPNKAIGKCLGLERAAGSLSGKFQVMKRPESFQGDFPADLAWEMIKQGVVNGVSIGFLPKEQRKPTAKDKVIFGDNCNRVISKSKLIECSITPIPANQAATIDQVSKKELDVKSTPDQVIEMHPNCRCYLDAENQWQTMDGACDKCVEAKEAWNNFGVLLEYHSMPPKRAAVGSQAPVAPTGPTAPNTTPAAPTGPTAPSGPPKPTDPHKMEDTTLTTPKDAVVDEPKKSIKKDIIFQIMRFKTEKELIQDEAKTAIRKLMGKMY